MKYFNNVYSLEELRKQYKELLKNHHPDNPNGSEDATKAINTEYDTLFKILKDKHEHKATDSDNSKANYNNMKWDYQEDEKLREILSKVINLSDITIEVCGSWLWIFGNTYEYKEVLKEKGFKYAKNKRAWYWHSEAFRKRSHKSLSMNDIRNYYGSTEVQTEEVRQLKQA